MPVVGSPTPDRRISQAAEKIAKIDGLCGRGARDGGRSEIVLGRVCVLIGPPQTPADDPAQIQQRAASRPTQRELPRVGDPADLHRRQGGISLALAELSSVTVSPAKHRSGCLSNASVAPSHGDLFHLRKPEDEGGRWDRLGAIDENLLLVIAPAEDLPFLGQRAGVIGVGCYLLHGS